MVQDVIISVFVKELVRGILAAILLVLASIPQAFANQEALVYQDAYGKLVYNTYANQGQTNTVNVVPDYSRAGYRGGGVPIPFVPAAIVLTDNGPGDDTVRIQSAIETVAGMPLDADGFRGAVLLMAGEYEVSEQLNINASGIVLRGEGSQEIGGTKIIFTSTAPAEQTATLIRVDGEGSPLLSSPTTIADSFLPVGAKSFTVTDTSVYKVGDMIRISRSTNDQWINDLGTDAYGWSADSYPLVYERLITKITGDVIHIDAPVIQTIEDKYGGGQIEKYSHPGQISNIGVEALRFESVYANSSDENHGWNAILISDARDSWVRQVTAKYFAYSCVYVQKNSHFITVEDSAQLDPKSSIEGGRRYSFVANDASYLLFQRNYANKGRHDFVTHSQTPGPHVFVDSLAEQSYADSGPHHRYAFGGLYDNIMNTAASNGSSAGRINIQNRRTSGSGHGWAGAQIMVWNSTAKGATVDAPPGAMNWSVGFVGEHEQGRWPPSEPDGIWQSENTRVQPRSLYYKQLEERLGQYDLQSVMLPQQQDANIWTELSAWAGNGLLLDDVIAWHQKGVRWNKAHLRAIVRNLQMAERGFTVAWSKISGPGEVIFDSPGALETGATFSESGAYTLQVTIDDGVTQKSNTIDVSKRFRINAGLNDAWYYPVTDGQGFFITVFPDLGAVSLAWFTYDTEFPSVDAVANLGDPGHRWLTAIGAIDGNKAVLTVEMTSGGIFDTASTIERTNPEGSDGTIVLIFDGCRSGSIEYDFPSINRRGLVPIRRIADDNVAICEALGVD